MMGVGGSGTTSWLEPESVVRREDDRLEVEGDGGVSPSWDIWASMFGEEEEEADDEVA